MDQPHTYPRETKRIHEKITDKYKNKRQLKTTENIYKKLIALIYNKTTKPLKWNETKYVVIV